MIVTYKDTEFEAECCMDFDADERGAFPNIIDIQPRPCDLDWMTEQDVHELDELILSNYAAMREGGDS